MLYIPYKYIIQSGFYVNKKFYYYKHFTLKKIFSLFYGLSKYRLFFYLKRFEFQFCETKFKIPNKSSGRFLLFFKIFNHYILKIFPIYFKLSSIKNLYIIRKWTIRCYEGICHKKGKPVHGQRTWSNASSAKNSNTYLRSYLKEMHRTRKSKRLKDQWQ